MSRAGATDARLLPDGCRDSARCRLAAGTYRLGDDSPLAGLRLTLPRGWSSNESDVGELSLIPAGHPQDRLFVWRDLVAVKSSGPGHGTTVLAHVGQAPAALVSWLTHNRDFTIVASPKAGTIFRGLRGTTLTVGVSRTASYGDPECPPNPRCADLFTNQTYWRGDFYGIGGGEEARLSLARIHSIVGKTAVAHTLFVAIDAPTGTQLHSLVVLATPVIASFRLPTDVRAG